MKTDYKTLYISRKVLNHEDITIWFAAQGIETRGEKMHVTLIYSKGPVDVENYPPNDFKITIPKDNFSSMSLFGGGDILVQQFHDDVLLSRHEEIMLGTEAIYDHLEYIPHITICYDHISPKLDEIKPYPYPIELGGEIYAEFDYKVVKETLHEPNNVLVSI